MAAASRIRFEFTPRPPASPPPPALDTTAADPDPANRQASCNKRCLAGRSRMGHRAYLIVRHGFLTMEPGGVGIALTGHHRRGASSAATALHLTPHRDHKP